MREGDKVDLGSIKIHKKVLEQIAESAIKKISGVQFVPKTFGCGLCDLLGIRNHPGIVVSVDKNNQVAIELKIVVRYGMNIPDIAREVQDAVRLAMEETVDMDLKDVHVNIQRIERGK